MNDFDNTMILPEREFLALASLGGVKSVAGLFGEDPKDFSDAEFARILFSMTRKEFLSITPDNITLQPQVSELIGVFRDEPETVILTPHAPDKAQLCLTCAGDRIVCTSRLAGSSDRLRLCVITREKLRRFLEKDGYLEDIPSAELKEDFVHENTDSSQVILTAEKIFASGEREVWETCFNPEGCYLTDPSGNTAPCCRKQLAKLILSLTESQTETEMKPE